MISGIAAVAGSVIGAPICMVIIVLELTNSYAFALSSLVGLQFLLDMYRYWSYFDVQLLNRGIDISDGRTGLFMTGTDILEFSDTTFVTVQDTDTVAQVK